MSVTPMQVLSRPFAVEPVTSIMLPDGIFDNALHNLTITCHYTNTDSVALTNVKIYLESVGDPGIVVQAHTYVFPTIPAGASVQLGWAADFTSATPGKPLISFVAQSDGHTSQRSLKSIFVSQTRYNPATKTYSCSVPEGTLVLSHIGALFSSTPWLPCDGKRDQCPPGLKIPTGMTLAWQPNPAYTGLHGDLPFADPWQKILAFLVFLVALIVGIVEAAKAGSTSVSVGGTFDETQPTVHCCSPATVEDATASAAAFTVAAAAAAVALTDAADPFWRGQIATPPGPGEVTTAEKVVAKWKFSQAPNAGVAYPLDVHWDYTRTTNASTYTHSVTETVQNIHVSDGVTVQAPATVHAYDPLWVTAEFQKTGADLYRGPELYGLAVFRSPQGLFFVEPLRDDGIGLDTAANDGTYTAKLNLREAYRKLVSLGLDPIGLWRVFIYAQDVNLVKPGLPPEIAAQTIGGFIVASSLTITFDPSLPCPIKAQAAINVV